MVAWPPHVTMLTFISWTYCDKFTGGITYGLREQPIDTFGAGFETGPCGQPKAFGLRVDTNHPARLDHRRAQQFVHEIGADVAGSNDRDRDLAHSHAPSRYGL